MQSFYSRYDALSAERKIKRWTRRKKEALINGGWMAVKLLNKRKK